MTLAKEGFTRPPRDPVPAGMQPAVCYAVIELGTQPAQKNTNFPGKKAFKVQIMWELVECRRDFTDKDGVTKNERAVLSKDFTLSLGENAKLRPFLEAWRGKKFTETELNGFDVGKLLGANCLLNVIHETKGGRVYERITGATPLPPRGYEKQAPENPMLHFDLEKFAGGELPERIPGWLKDKIRQSDEWHRLERQGLTDGDPGSDEPPLPDDSEVPF